MVKISKQPKRNDILYKKVVAFIALCILLWAGIHWFSWVVSMISSENSDVETYQRGGLQLRTLQSNVLQQQQQQQQQKQSLQQIKELSHQQSTNELKTESILIRAQLQQLSSNIPLSPKREDESKFISAVSKECIPGRDDSTNGEINPTTHRKRECLRHVPLQKENGNTNINLEESMKRQKPRIGLMIPPGYISASFADWAASALKATGDGINMDVEILTTSRVPVYGYGKSHGFSKLIRFVSLPLSLAAYDAYLFASGNDDLHKASLRSTLDEMKLGRDMSPPSAAAIGRMLQLEMRWHCRLSHVSMHTSMLTLTLEDVLKDPVDVLASILSFVWREDWEWEGHGGKQQNQGVPLARSWTEEARDLVENQHQGHQSVQKLYEQTKLVAEETASLASGDTAFQKAIQGAFASEMKRSSDMTAWPCPSFWVGVDSTKNNGVDGNADNGNDDQMMRALRQAAGEMVPNCRDNDPFVRCTVNKDRCEVKGDAICK